METTKTENLIHLPLCLKIITETQGAMKHELKKLRCGLFICEIKITNLWDKTQELICKALVDSGSEFTIICKSLFEQFNVDQERVTKCRISTSGNPDTDAKKCPFYINVPSNSRLNYLQEIVIANFDNRDEYKAIIGMDMLQHFDLTFKGDEYKAWLEY